MVKRVNDFWSRISDGLAINQLWAQVRGDAEASYRLYSEGIKWERGEAETRSQRLIRVARGLFWAMVMKLRPARRVLLVSALVLTVFPGLHFQSRDVSISTPNLSFFGTLLLLGLLALELADRVVMKRDLEIAKEIQTWLMPSFPPQAPGFEMAFATRPANTVAGDYYDAFYRTNPSDLQPGCAPLILVVADVAGKSVPAALLMATLQASLRTLAGVCTSVPELVDRWNQYCCAQNVGGQRFTTAFLAELDPASGRFRYVNAGHNWPVLRRASGAVERLDVGGVPIGLMPKAHYECGEVTLAPGDLLLVFTDGLVEAEDRRSEQYGEPRMLATLQSGPRSSADEVLRRVMMSADGFVGSAPQHDDITCLVLRATPAPLTSAANQI
jgi:serine phosphatase RsbU (regulator of sigma subunit)